MAVLARVSCPLKEVVGKLRLRGAVTVRAAEPAPAGGLCFALRVAARLPRPGGGLLQAAGGVGRVSGQRSGSSWTTLNKPPWLLCPVCPQGRVRGPGQCPWGV